MFAEKTVCNQFCMQYEETASNSQTGRKRKNIRNGIIERQRIVSFFLILTEDMFLLVFRERGRGERETSM